MRPPFCPPGSEDEDQGSCRPPFRRLFGRGGPFARARGARLFDSGALRLLTLGLIEEAPRHGYEIIKALKARFQGAYSPSPGSIYPILQALHEAGLVTSQSFGPRRSFSITPAGRAYLAENAPEFERIKAQLEEASAPIGNSALGAAIAELRAAIFEKMRGGGLSPERAEKLGELLRRAKEEIERI
jgi:DNA-binding PadR family transcriptional regulator